MESRHAQSREESTPDSSSSKVVVFFLTPGCPSVFRCQEPSLGRCWGSSLCRSLTPSGASVRPCHVHPTAGLLGCFCCDAQKRQGPCCTGLWASPLSSLSLSDPSSLRPGGNSGGLFLKQGEPGYRPQREGRVQACVPAPLGCLESSCSSLERHSGCSIGSQVLDVVVFSLFLFS